MTEPTIEVTGQILGEPLATYYVAENSLVPKSGALYVCLAPRWGS